MHYPYDAFLKGTGLTVNLFRIQWYTTAFNRLLVKWGTNHPRLLYYSFNFGVYVTILLLPVAVVLLIVSAFHTSTTTEGNNQQDDTVRLEVLIPGVNLPLEEIGYFVTSLAICSIFHELGHALAAVTEDVNIISIGLHVILIIPTAFTELSADQLHSLKTWQKLRVMCAGIWHNIILAFFGYLIFISLPYILSPFFSVSNGVVVSEIIGNSPIVGAKGLAVNDVIVNINDCKVTDLDSWYNCLLDTIKLQPAYCIESGFVHQNDESVAIIHKNNGIIECCDEKNVQLSCYEYMLETIDEAAELQQYMCLNVRKTIEHSMSYCHKSFRCKKGVCIRPLMNNATTVIHMIRDNKPDVIYMGQPSDVTLNVRSSNYVPRTTMLSSKIPDTIQLFLKYVVMFSCGLAIFNVIPCFCFDGQHITTTLINQILSNRVKQKNNREIIALCVTVIGTMFILVTVIKVSFTTLSKAFF